VRRIEALGYAVVNHGDHIGFMGPISALAAAATATSTLRVGSSLFCNDYRHPLLLAQEAATIDALSAGRFEFGLGAGWQQHDYDAMGLPMEGPAVRIDRLAEAVAIAKRYFAGERFSFTGRFYRVDDAIALPRVVQSPRPPIVLGGGGRRMLTLAAAEADIVTLNITLRTGDMVADRSASGSVSQFRERVALVRDVAGDRFDDVELGIYVHVCRVGHDASAGVAEAAAAMGMDPDAAVESPHVLVGTPSEVAAKLRHLRDEYSLSYFSIDNDAVEAFAPVVERLAGT
jgi:probable F420-dependent oxidoreductase